MSWVPTNFPIFHFFVPHTKTHKLRGLRRHYHLRLDPNLENGTCEILQIPYACVECTDMLDNTWYPGVSKKETNQI